MLSILLVVSLWSPGSAGAGPSAVGGPDPSFGIGGKAVTPIGGGGDGGSSVMVLPDGSFLVGDYADLASRDFALVKYTPNGGLDTSFGAGQGYVTTDFNGGLDYSDQIAMDAAGRILLAGCAGPTPGSSCDDFALARYLPNGNLDTSFGGGDGKVTKDFNGKSDSVYGMAIMPNGDIALAGTAQDASGSQYSSAVAMYKPNGDLDPSFGGTGVVSGGSTTGLFPEAAGATGDGKFVVAGSAGANFFVARYLPTGVLDPAFGTGGILKTTLGGSEVIDALAVRADGSIVIGGIDLATNGAFLVARVTSSGQLDPAFGTGGGTITDFGSGYDRLFGIAVQPDGKIVAAGGAQVSGNDHEFAAARYTSDGQLDPSFGAGGMATVDLGTSYDEALAVGIQPSGRIVLVGQAGNDTALVGLLGDSGPGCTIIGTSGNDHLTGTDRADVMCGTSGNDVLTGLGGADVLLGGDGTDTVSFANAPSSVSVNLGKGTATGDGTDSIVGVENATGSSSNDSLTGSSGANVLSGGGGNDKLSGGGGNDRLLGGPGNDTMNGGAGTDTCKQGPGTGTKKGCEKS
jgi:uncharacterized delta-60 repeat protein